MSDRVLKWVAMSWGSFWLAWSAGAILCVYSDYVAMEFEEVAQSTFSWRDGHSRGWTIGSILEVWRW